MGLRQLVFQTLFGAVGFALLLQTGRIVPQGDFLTNVMWGAINILVSKGLAYLVAGGIRKR